MTKIDFFLRAMINLIYWGLSLFVLTYVIPTVVVLFAGKDAKPLPFDFSGLADLRVITIQIIAALLGIAITKALQFFFPPAPPAAAPNPPAANAGVASLFKDEIFSICVNFGTVSLMVALFLHTPLFFISFVVCYLVAYVLK